MDTVSISRCIGSGIVACMLYLPRCAHGEIHFVNLWQHWMWVNQWTFVSLNSNMASGDTGHLPPWFSSSVLQVQVAETKGDRMTGKNVGLYEIVMFYNIERLLFVGYSHWSLIESMFIVSSTLLPHCIFGPVRMFSPCHQQDKKIYLIQWTHKDIQIDLINALTYTCIANCVQKSDEVDWIGAAIGLTTHWVQQKSDRWGGSLDQKHFV